MHNVQNMVEVYTLLYTSKKVLLNYSSMYVLRRAHQSNMLCVCILMLSDPSLFFGKLRKKEPHMRAIYTATHICIYFYGAYYNNSEEELC